MAGEKIMVVDDDDLFLSELKEILSLSGYDAIAVKDPLQVIDTAVKIKPSVILLDLKMQDKDGFQIAKELKQLPEFSQVSVIAMTAFYTDDHPALLDNYGIKKCLRKPFNPLDLIVHLETELIGRIKN